MRVKTEKVTQLMQEKELTAEKLSYCTGLGIKSLEWILRNGMISEDAIERIAEALKVPVKEIYRTDELGCSESGIEWTRGNDRATCQFVKSRYATRIKKLAAKYPEECEIVVENKDGSILAHIPVKWISINPPKKIELSDEERERRRRAFIHNCR